MTAAPRPHVRADPALAAEGRRLVEQLFGDMQTFLDSERYQRPLLRRAISSPFRLTSEAIWALVESESLDVSSAQFRLVRATPDGFDAARVEEYATWRETASGKILVPRPADVRRLYLDGYSIAAQLLDRFNPWLAHLCGALSACTGHPSQVSAYLSPGSGGALQVHHDTHDVVILQCAGSKAYDLYDPVVDRPIPTIHLDPADVAETPPNATVTLEPGDMLYLPRGFPHRAVSGADGSLHLTIGLLSITWSSLMRSLAEDLVYVADLREAIGALRIFDPEALGRDAQAAAHALAAWLRSEGGERLAALAAGALVNSFALRDDPSPQISDEAAVVAIDPSPIGGATLRWPTGQKRLSSFDPELAAWCATPAGPAGNMESETTLREGV